MRLGFVAAALTVVVGNSGAPPAQAAGPEGDFRRAVLVSWDGVRRDVLFDLLYVSDPAKPCWDKGNVFPVPTAWPGAATPYTCLPGLGGARPPDAAPNEPAYPPFQMLTSHTTNDGNTMTKPQHASMLTGLNTLMHGIPTNETKGPLQPGVTIYEILMNAFDPLSPFGERDGYKFRTLQSSSRKYVGRQITRWASGSDALQIDTSNGNDAGDRPGPLSRAELAFERWKQDELERGLPDTAFFVMLHFKSPDWAGHKAGAGSPQYRRAIVETDRKLYTLLEMLRAYGWDDAAVLVTTDHGFARDQHARDGGRNVFNTWLAAFNVALNSDELPLRTPHDYCLSHSDPDACLVAGPAEPMPAEDVVPNFMVTAVTPTLLDMFGVEWRTTTGIEGVSLYQP